jgi:hypothetical protein
VRTKQTVAVFGASDVTAVETVSEMIRRVGFNPIIASLSVSRTFGEYAITADATWVKIQLQLAGRMENSS